MGFYYIGMCWGQPRVSSQCLPSCSPQARVNVRVNVCLKWEICQVDKLSLLTYQESMSTKQETSTKQQESMSAKQESMSSSSKSVCQWVHVCQLSTSKSVFQVILKQVNVCQAIFKESMSAKLSSSNVCLKQESMSAKFSSTRIHVCQAIKSMSAKLSLKQESQCLPRESMSAN